MGVLCQVFDENEQRSKKYENRLERQIDKCLDATVVYNRYLAAVIEVHLPPPSFSRRFFDEDR